MSILTDSLANPILILGCAVLVIIIHVIITAFFGPLSHIPGPFYAKFSSIWIVLQCRGAKRSSSLLRQHQIHGDFVRIAPNHISISTRSALDLIYGHKSGFLKGPFYEDKLLPFHQVEPVLFNTRDTRTHQRKKKYLSAAFSAKNLSEYEPHMSEQVAKLIRCFSRHTEIGKALVNFNDYSNFLAFDVIGDYAFGHSFDFLNKEQDHLNLIATINSRGEVLNALGHVPQFLRPMMKYCFFDSFWSAGLRATSNLASIGTKAYFQRKDQESTRKDLLSFLFNAKDPDTELPLTENEIIAESISFIVGGSDTTSSTMTNVVDILARSPEIQRQLQQELDTIFPEPIEDGWVADFQTVNQLPVLNAIVRETMRFKPTSATGLERVTPAGGKSIAGQYIPEGSKTLVSVPTLSIHHDPITFPNPEVFDISRWLTESSSGLFDCFFPFSLGPRACVGRNFSWMEILKTLATCFRLYEFERVNHQDTEVREGFFVKNSECNVWIRRRVANSN